MNFEIQIDPSSFPEFENMFREVRIACQDAMASRFAELCRENVGEENGSHRPSEWEALRDKRYAKKVGRDYATLYLNGALYNSIQTILGMEEYAECFVDDSICPYAVAHQNGEGNMPRRPFFEVTLGDQITPYAEKEMMDTAQATIDRLLN